MQSNYDFKPRGIIKWHAFSALISGEEQKENAKDIETIDIELLDDKQDYLNYIINESLLNNYSMGIKYVDNNEIKYFESTPIRVDTIEKNLIFKDITLSIYQIIDLIILGDTTHEK